MKSQLKGSESRRPYTIFDEIRVTVVYKKEQDPTMETIKVEIYSRRVILEISYA